jgi:hypothetical protein
MPDTPIQDTTLRVDRIPSAIGVLPAPQDPFNDSSGLRISAWISARYALSQWAMAKPGTQSAQKEYLDDHPDFG